MGYDKEDYSELIETYEQIQSLVDLYLSLNQMETALEYALLGHFILDDMEEILDEIEKNNKN